jgi:predicted nucleotidyltransferase
MGIDEILAGKRDDILRIAAKHGVTSIRVFGSVARGDAGPQSDVDFLIEIGDDTPLGFPEDSSPIWRNCWGVGLTSPRRRGSIG